VFLQRWPAQRSMQRGQLRQNFVGRGQHKIRYTESKMKKIYGQIYV